MRRDEKLGPESGSRSLLEALKKRPFFMVVLSIGLLLAIGVSTFAGPCVHDDGSYATCFGASCVIVACGIVAVIVAAIGLFSRNATAGRACACFSGFAGLLAALAPDLILPLCMMQTMRCWTIMRPFALICGIVIIVCALVQLIRLRNGRGI